LLFPFSSWFEVDFDADLEAAGAFAAGAAGLETTGGRVGSNRRGAGFTGAGACLGAWALEPGAEG
jgi:hypothetical protein